MAELNFKEVPLIGKWKKSVDPILLDDNDYADIQNLRYLDRGLKSVAGMTKVNTTALTTYTKIRSGFHYCKDEPSESHVLVQAWNTGKTASNVYQNTTAIASQGDFSATVLLDETGSTVNKGRFSDAPQGQVAYCNGKTANYIYSGDEKPCSAFFVYDPDDDDFSYDYSKEVNNKRSVSPWLAYIQGCAATMDDYTKLMLHGNGSDGATSAASFVDSSGSARVPNTVGGNTQLDTAQKKFGTASILFDGTGDYLGWTDHADWNLGTGAFTIDFWVRFNALPSTGKYMGLFRQYVDADNFYSLSIYNSSGTYYFHVTAESSASSLISGVSLIPITVATGTWYHITISRGVLDADILSCYLDGFPYYNCVVGTLPDLAAEFEIGRGYVDGTNDANFNGWIDEFRFSKGIVRFSHIFEPPTTEYSTTSKAYLRIGSTRRVDRIKFYVGTANDTAGTMKAYYWDRTAWVEDTGMVDGTISSAKTLGQTGTVTLTQNTQPSMYKGLLLYWWKIELSACNEATTVYYCTISKSTFMYMVNLWDGVYRLPSAVKRYKGQYEDFTLDVNIDTPPDYTTNTVTMDLDSLSTSQFVVVGFVGERMRGLLWRMWRDRYNGNTCSVIIYYWNGETWATVGNVDDGTSSSGKSLKQNGIMSWEPPTDGTEFPRTIKDSIPMYFYKIAWNAALDSQVDVDRIMGIPHGDTIGIYSFPVMHQGRLFLFDEIDGKRNSCRFSGINTPEVWNGNSSGYLFFGDEKKVTAAASFFARWGANAYYSLVVCKQNEVWLVEGGTSYTVYRITETLGCPSPMTMVVADIGQKIIEGVERQVVLWMSASGPVMFDGATVTPIWDDIADYWNQLDSTNYINVTYIDDFYAWYDPQYQEYHLCIATGSNTSCDTELVYDLRRKRWTKINRGSGLALQTGFPVKDTSGRFYTYGTIDTGFMYRLEYGLHFEATDITAYFKTKDFLLSGNMMEKSSVEFLKLSCLSKSAEAIAVTHYADGDTTGTAMTAVTNQTSGKRIVLDLQRAKILEGISHQFKFQLAHDDINESFQPLALSMAFKVHPDPTLV